MDKQEHDLNTKAISNHRSILRPQQRMLCLRTRLGRGTIKKILMHTPKTMANQSKPNEAYYDRNQAALAFAKLAKEKGWNVGIGVDPDEPDWPVLYVDTPEGQVSWHLPKEEVISDWPKYEKEWDGHSVQQKRTRMSALIRRRHLAA